MKKYSTNAPLIFGIIFLIVGIVAGQIPIIFLFGVLPIVASIMMKCSDHKAKKQGKETSTERANRIYQESLKTSKNTRAQKSCCAKCGVDLSLVSAGLINKIGDKYYCDVCGHVVLNDVDDKALPKVEPQIEKTISPTQRQHITCARCKKNILVSQSVCIGNHRFCRECSLGHAYPKKTTGLQEKKRIQVQRLVNVLGQIQEQKTQLSPCSVCRRSFADKKLIFVDGEYYCKDCYSFTRDKGRREKSIAMNELHQISYELSGMFEQSLYSRLIEVTDRLIIGGFKFHSASVGDGVNEFMAHKASYTDYDAFKNNVESNFQKNAHEGCENSDGCVSSLDYSYICAFLSRKTLKVCVLSERDHIVLRWIDTSDKAFATTRMFAEKVIEEAYDNKCTLKQIDNIELNIAFLNNWN